MCCVRVLARQHSGRNPAANNKREYEYENYGVQVQCVSAHGYASFRHRRSRCKLRRILHAIKGPVKHIRIILWPDSDNVTLSTQPDHCIHEVCIHGECIHGPSHRDAVLLQYRRRRLTLSRDRSRKGRLSAGGPEVQRTTRHPSFLNLCFCVKKTTRKREAAGTMTRPHREKCPFWLSGESRHRRRCALVPGREVWRV